MRKLKRKNAGYMTVEATIVVSVMLLVIMVLIYSFMLMYQFELVQHAATVGAERGATASVIATREAFDGDDMSTVVTETKKTVEGILKKSMISVKDTQISVDKVKTGLPFSTGIRVSIHQDAKVPLLGFFNDLGLTKIGIYDSVAVAEIVAPQDTIRNTDLGVDIAKRGIATAKSVLTSGAKFLYSFLKK